MFRLTVIEEPPLSSSEQKHREDDNTGAIPYSDRSHEQSRAGSADGSIAGPLDEAEECLTVDRSGHGERNIAYTNEWVGRTVRRMWYPVMAHATRAVDLQVSEAEEEGVLA